MERQTRDDYSAWLIFCDETTEPTAVESVEGSVETLPERKSRTSLERGIGIPEAVSEGMDDDTDVLITTMLDSDDCFHAEMIATVRSYAEACGVREPRGGS